MATVVYKAVHGYIVPRGRNRRAIAWTTGLKIVTDTVANATNIFSLVTKNSGYFVAISREFSGQTLPKINQWKRPNFWLFSGKILLDTVSWSVLRWWQTSVFNVFLTAQSSFALSTTIGSRNEPMAKPLTSTWLVPSFSQHKLAW